MNDTFKIYEPLTYGLNCKPKLIAEGTHANLKYYIYSMGSHPCAYVEVTGTPYAGMDYLDDNLVNNLICHGGITYSEGNLHDLDTKGHWYLGWDYAHFRDWYGDDPLLNLNHKKWTVEEIAQECCNVINQIIEPLFVWNVYRLDFNTKKITVFNIFEHNKFEKEVKKLLDSDIDKSLFSEKLRSLLFYYYASKCEYEIGVTSWPPCAIDEKTKEPKIYEKIDIYQQVKLNWDAFVDYLWKKGKNNE